MVGEEASLVGWNRGWSSVVRLRGVMTGFEAELTEAGPLGGFLNLWGSAVSVKSGEGVIGFKRTI